MLLAFAMADHTHNDYLPAHASPAFPPILSPQAHAPSRTISDFHLHHSEHEQQHHDPPPVLISPAFTPPSTPGTGTPAVERDAKSVFVDTSLDSPAESAPRLLEKLPEVRCEVRARIPTTTGQEMFLYLYKNDVDSKEHLAIVFGPHIRSKSLDAVRPGETERDRMIRGAYVGRLHPGRVSSRIEQIRMEALSQKAVVGPAAPQSGGATTTSTGIKQVSPPFSTGAQPAEQGILGHAAPLSTGSATTKAVESPSHAVQAVQDGVSALRANGTSTATHTVPIKTSPLVRIHSECYTGETVWSARCDCGEQLDEAARLMALPSNKAGGCIIYLRQEGRGIGLGEKLKAYNLQDLGHDTYEANLLLRHPADARSYGLATAMLVDLDLGGEEGIRLLTNNPEKVRAVEGPGREVVVKERVAMVPLAWQTGGKTGVQGEEVEKYLSTKVCISSTIRNFKAETNATEQIEKFKHLIG
jgi:GTP cyclohydrolase II